MHKCIYVFVGLLHVRRFLTKFDWVNVALLHCWCCWEDDNIIISLVIIRNQNAGWVWIVHVFYFTPWDAGSWYIDLKINWRWRVTNLQWNNHKMNEGKEKTVTSLNKQHPVTGHFFQVNSGFHFHSRNCIGNMAHSALRRLQMLPCITLHQGKWNMFPLLGLF